jgi:chromosome segregation ATPase
MDKLTILTEALNRNAFGRNEATVLMQECQGRVSEVQADCKRSQEELSEARRSDQKAASRLESIGELISDSSDKPQFLFDEQCRATAEYQKSQERLKWAADKDDKCRQRLAVAERRLEEARAEVDRLATACSDAQKQIARYGN